MAYSRTRLRARRTPRRTIRRTVRRRSTVKRRVYPKRRPMTRKRILNTVSIKKRDNMICYTNSTAANQTGSSNYSGQAAIVTGGLPDTQCATFLWCATARDRAYTSGPAAEPAAAYTSSLTTDVPYFVGLSEKVEIQTNSSAGWQWRRICFTAKGFNNVLSLNASFQVGIENCNGWTRVANQMSGTPASGQMATLYNTLFRGVYTSDWIDPIIAPTDNRRLTIKYDRTVLVQSPNQVGTLLKKRLWHGMYKNLQYDVDESGGMVTEAAFSSLGKAGMGDYYVVDLFKPSTNSGTADTLSFKPHATLYWHER